MSQALLYELQKENLCTHFILPLLKLNKVSFTPSGFMDCYLTRDLKRIAVRLGDTLLLSRTVLSHPEFSAIYKDHDGSYLVMYRIPKRWKADLDLFAQGKYSMLSAKAKDYITRFSGLHNRKKNKNGEVRTDGRLLALDKHEVLKGMWVREFFTPTGKALDDPDLHMPDEYLSKPGELSYIDPVGLTRIRETQL